MDRLACFDVAELPLQILLGRSPEWAGLPVAVVDEDRPQGTVLWANERAREHRVLPGLRYAAALSLCRELRASVVPPEAVGAAVARLVALLRRFTPHVEPSLDEPGIFWLDASGLGRLYPSLDAWAHAVVAALADEGFAASAAVGFTRFGAYAIARAQRGVVVFETADAEREAAGGVPLDRLALAPRVRDRLDRLGVRTVGELAALPVGGLAKRYGAEVHALHRLIRGELFAPLTPIPERPPTALRERLDDFLERDAHRLLLRLERLLGALAEQVGARAAVITEVRLTLRLDGGKGPPDERSHRFRPAAPTLDTALLLDLIRLRLESVDLSAGVSEWTLRVEEIPATPEQLRLFALAPRRDQEAAERALARVRAELGDGAVGVYVLRSGHLPRARFGLAPIERLRPPRVEARVGPRPLVRRLLPRPEALPSPPRQARNDGWQPRDPRQGPIVATQGPFIISGGWWQAEVHREYAFAQTQRGDILWVFYDRRRRRWFLQGRVE